MSLYYDQILDWLVENGFDPIKSSDDPHGVNRGSGSGIKMRGLKPSHLQRGPYLLRVSEDAVYEMHIRDDGVTGLVYQSWAAVGQHPYKTKDELKTILDKLTKPKATCWE